MMDLAVKDIRHGPRRFIFTCLGIGLLLMVVMSMGGIYRGLVDDATLIVHKTGAEVWVVQKDTNGPFAEDSRIPEDLKYTLWHPARSGGNRGDVLQKSRSTGKTNLKGSSS